MGVGGWEVLTCNIGFLFGPHGILTKALFLSVFSQLNLLQTNGQTDNFTIGKTNLMMRAFALASVAKHVFPNGNSVHFSTNRETASRCCTARSWFARECTLFPFGHSFFIFVISNISAKQTSHLCLYKLD